MPSIKCVSGGAAPSYSLICDEMVDRTAQELAATRKRPSDSEMVRHQSGLLMVVSRAHACDVAVG